MSKPVRGANSPGISISAADRFVNNALTTLLVLFLAFVFFAMCAPVIIRPHGRAREAEVKQNLHAIQLAVERYATDHDGQYPRYLYGGDNLGNIGTVNYYNPEGLCAGTGWPGAVRHPLDERNAELPGLDYSDVDWEYIYGLITDPESDELEAVCQGLRDAGILVEGEYATFGDVLSHEGYMPKYPRNPFAKFSERPAYRGRMNAREWYGLSKDNPPVFSLYAGMDGQQMFNTGWFGELVQVSRLDAQTDKPQLDFPGCFYYHPRFADGATNHGHLVAAQMANPGLKLPGDYSPTLNPPLCDVDDVFSPVVSGYDLFAFGSPKTRGQDLDNSVGLPGSPHAFRSGYATLGQERNPWVQSGDYDGKAGDYDERPCTDGVYDFYIIHLGNGMDKKLAERSGQRHTSVIE